MMHNETCDSGWAYAFLAEDMRSDLLLEQNSRNGVALVRTTVATVTINYKTFRWSESMRCSEGAFSNEKTQASE
jgi:hypothetical protein